MNVEKELYSYGWVDEKAGTVHIPIERAMDLIAQRGLPVRGQGGTGTNLAQQQKEPGKTQSSNDLSATKAK